MDSFPKIGGKTPPNHPICFNRGVPLFSPSILGETPLFLETPIWTYTIQKKNFSLPTHFWGVTPPTGGKIIPRIRFFLACSTASVNFFSSKSSASFSRDLMQGNALQLQESYPPKTTFVQDSHRKGKGKFINSKVIFVGICYFLGRLLMDILDVFWISISPVTPMDFQYFMGRSEDVEVIQVDSYVFWGATSIF